MGPKISDPCPFLEQQVITIDFFQSIYAQDNSKDMEQKFFASQKFLSNQSMFLVKQEKKWFFIWNFLKFVRENLQDKLKQAFLAQTFKVSIKLQSDPSTKAEGTCF